MSIRQSVADAEFFTVGPVVTSVDDPTGDEVEMAFVDPAATPETDDWEAATWVDGPPFFIRRMVYGADAEDPPNGSTVLEIGTYVCWVKIHDNPETIVRPADVLTVYGPAVVGD